MTSRAGREIDQGCLQLILVGQEQQIGCNLDPDLDPSAQGRAEDFLQSQKQLARVHRCDTQFAPPGESEKTAGDRCTTC